MKYIVAAAALIALYLLCRLFHEASHCMDDIEYVEL